MKRIILKVLLVLVVAFLLGVPLFVAWMKAGEEAPLDYSAMDFEQGPPNSEFNGYTVLRQFLEQNQANIPDDYPVKYSEDYGILVDYDQHEDWDLEVFKQILETNRGFVVGVETALDMPEFAYDAEFSPDALFPVVGGLRSYVSLRLLEARIHCLVGRSDEALNRLADLNEELERLTRAGGALIGILTSAACNGILTAEIWEYQAHVELPSKQLRLLGEGYNVSDYFDESVQSGIRQEFQFVRYMVSSITEQSSGAYETAYGERPSAAERLLHEVAIYVGLRENRTINTIFHGYSEAADQVLLPVCEQNLSFSQSISGQYDDTEWLRFMNRNPYGEQLLSVLFPSIDKVLSVVDRAQTSASATRISICLQAYYQETGSLPESLEALVPDYFDAIPKDPYNGEPIRYSREKKIVYSVGNDFIDQGGSEKQFIFQLDPDDDYYSAELDQTEPTYPLRFAM